MEQNDQTANHSANQPRSQAATPPAPQYVNTWKPVTDIYIEREATGIAAPVIVEPPKPAPGPVSQRDLPKRSVPVGLHVITGLVFLRALIYFVLGSALVSDPDSDFSKQLGLLSPALIPFTVTHRHPEMFVKLVGEAMLVVAGLSVIAGIAWLFRWWIIRWVTMCYTGGMVLRVAIRSFAGAVSGAHTGPLGSNLYNAGAFSGLAMGLSSDEITAVLLISCAINLIICGYLAFYPGVKLAFEKTY